ncbi:MAG: antibiotic biosynthesis monooxygenase family protein [Planctomycetota bacterium]
MDKTQGTPCLGFAVLYRWRLKEGTEAQFSAAWADITRFLREQRGALGSRLHRCDDGTWMAYAQWPTREAWSAMQGSASGVPEASRVMKECILESFEDLPLTPEVDLLIPATC